MKWCSSTQCRTPLPTPRHAISSRVDYQPVQINEGRQTAEMQIVIKNKEDKLQRAREQAYAMPLKDFLATLSTNTRLTEGRVNCF